MRVRTFASGPIDTNAFLVIDEATKKAIIFDAPPDSLDLLTTAVRDEQVEVELLVITHHHWDHIGDGAALASALNVPVAAHPASVPFLERPAGGPVPIAPITVDRLLNDGDSVEIGSLHFQVLHTPGHAPGEITLYTAEHRAMFGGDTLFPNGYGRTDISGASEDETLSTLRRLLELPDDVTVYPGHGLSTTIGAERRWMERMTRGLA
ncbi:MAG TPA: MBL fold metallo-hydrolase [Nitrolancea sp.]|nr:MBL fold metallo-hydrolase [Nitrolancea sp.]